MRLTGKAPFLAISLLCVVFLMHEVKSDDDNVKLDSTDPDGHTFGEDGAEETMGGYAEGQETADEEEEEEIDESKLGYEMDNGVVVLKDDNMADFLQENSEAAPVLVEFYAPWCGHCKSLAPEFERAAKQLKKLKNPVYLAKVDATEEKELATKYGVSGYPTLKWFRDGQAYDYDGPREENGIVEYMKQRASADWKPPPVAVVTLTRANFSDFINSNDLSLVEFYAPWCGHCKKLAPEYEKAAQLLMESDNPIPLAKVDATDEPDLASAYGVTGYPTLKIFRRGTSFEYKGDMKEHAGIVSHMEKQRGDPSTEKKSLKDVQRAMEEADVTVVGFFAEEDFSYRMYLDACNDIRNDYTFVHTFDASARDHYKVNVNSVVVFQAERFYTKYESKRSVYEVKIGNDLEASEIRTFIAANNVPLVGEYSERYEARPVVLVFYTVDFSFEGRTATQIWRNKVAAIANDFKELTFAIADEELQNTLFKDFGFMDSGEEFNVGILADKDRKYPMAPEEYDEDNVRGFLKSYVAGKAKSLIKSAPAPKKQKGPVRVVVGNTFEKIVLDPKKDVLIEMYAPWCGHCKTLEPMYKELAKKLKADKNLVIAKMDATANDPPIEYSVSGFPTIYFAPAGDKQNPVKFEGGERGGRTMSDFMDFLTEHATVSMGGGSEKEEL